MTGKKSFSRMKKIWQVSIWYLGFKDQETRRPKQFEDDVEGEGEGSEESADQINVDGIDDGLLEEVIKRLQILKNLKLRKMSNLG